MEYVGILFAVGAVALRLSGPLVSVIKTHLNSRENNKIISQAAERYGCIYSKGLTASNSGFSGRVRGVGLNVNNITDSDSNTLDVTINFYTNYKGSFSIRKETAFSRLKNSAGIKDLETGDKSFDDCMYVSAESPLAVTALLNKQTRDKIRVTALRANHLAMTSHSLNCIFEISKISAPETLHRKIDPLLDLAEDISGQINLRDRLIENISSEKNPEVVINNIRALVKNSGEKDNTEVLAPALGNSSIAVQVEAAVHLGDRGAEHLCRLLEPGRIIPPDLVGKAVMALVRRKHYRTLPVLIEVYWSKINIEVRKIILIGLKELGDSKGEPFLLEVLDNRNGELRSGAIEALGTCGTVSSVEKLYLLSKETMNPFTKNAAQKSISRIQSRLDNAEKGWLSIPETAEKEGALSRVGDSPEGGLSMTVGKGKNAGLD